MNLRGPDRPVTHATKVAFTAAIMVLLVICGLAVNYWLTVRTIDHTETQWCDTLSLLTSKPVAYPSDPQKNPSRVGQYELYEDFVHLKSKFGCK